MRAWHLRSRPPSPTPGFFSLLPAYRESQVQDQREDGSQRDAGNIYTGHSQALDAQAG